MFNEIKKGILPFDIFDKKNTNPNKEITLKLIFFCNTKKLYVNPKRMGIKRYKNKNGVNTGQPTRKLFKVYTLKEYKNEKNILYFFSIFFS